MVTTLDDTKRNAIAIKLANLKLIQQLIIENDELFLRLSTDAEISDRLRKMLEDDRKNLGVVETTIVQYGIQKDPGQTVQEMCDKIRQLMRDSKLSFYEKIFQHELLKHQQVMSGVVIHKAAQKVGADVMAAITPLNTVNFENRAHQEQLKGILEILGVRELTGQDADQGIWGRVQDAIATFSGALGSAVTQTTDKKDMNIQDVIRMDHNKVNILFTELLQSNDPQKIQEYFGQIYKDLTAHAEAEEEVVYPRVRSFYGDSNTQELYDEQAQMKRLLEEIRAISPSTPEFKDKVRNLMDIVGDHIRQEESTMFASIRNNLSTQQTEELATQFKAAKSRIQERLGGTKTGVNV
ncbi:hemerythrin domain-containing protein [Umezakia ovalisporum]|jgi:hemerythrin superfamily protein|uniref:Hemerythrin domain-containing protein n=1 Tax=Umezakia ovalisporum FSS-43 TaxID=2740520 RepID=A0ABT6K666_9CYAN|nr:hemerythrin domain-containing protein [Umezakia ovalisporum]MDH6057580.1 hemerythrin domain-containing protein [Umezakia ovalisporum FSS-43]MDH6072388.1 hemerythrin domain-containing protein [Umezakia ovalisporum CobakiLakeA]MDH6075830.1 hemerythrin domain-containing protein [Umezakia ovalisporum CS-1034]MDH6082181.1 hemerythrin domain-containing protein [Umezakia ovalisporum FSS-44]MDH6084120.1 hemerythrin domain-containing protein [Umezakia ovalisporum TAC611]